MFFVGGIACPTEASGQLSILTPDHITNSVTGISTWVRWVNKARSRLHPWVVKSSGLQRRSQARSRLHPWVVKSSGIPTHPRRTQARRWLHVRMGRPSGSVISCRDLGCSNKPNGHKSTNQGKNYDPNYSFSPSHERTSLGIRIQPAAQAERLVMTLQPVCQTANACFFKELGDHFKL